MLEPIVRKDGILIFSLTEDLTTDSFVHYNFQADVLILYILENGVDWVRCHLFKNQGRNL